MLRKLIQNHQDANTKVTEKKDEDKGDALNDFFDDVETVTVKKGPKPELIKPLDDEATTSTNKEEDTENKIQIQLSDLGNTQTQLDCLLCPNHEWYNLNLNPYRVLDISHRAPKKLISRWYKALSLLLHPDKICNTCRGGSEKAFESVRKTMESLQDYLLL